MTHNPASAQDLGRKTAPDDQLQNLADSARLRSVGGTPLANTDVPPDRQREPGELLPLPASDAEKPEGGPDVAR